MASSTRVLFGRFDTDNNVIFLVCFWVVTEFFNSTFQQLCAQRIVYRFPLCIQSENQKEKRNQHLVTYYLQWPQFTVLFCSIEGRFYRN